MLTSCFGTFSLKAHNTDRCRAKLTLSFAQSRRRNEMKCQRCGNDKEAEFRVVSDILDIKVCADCAAEARKIGLPLEIVKIDKANNERAASKAEARGYRMAIVSDGAH